ncbi:MAG: ABC transporter ATP-binding protein, partial [Acidobacteriota bacterium]
RREHESLLKEWRGASFDLLRASVVAQGAQSLLGFLLAAWLLTDHLGRAGTSGGVLLLVYWALQLPNLGRQVAMAARQYPMIRSIVLRLMEPLTAPEDEPLLGTAEETAEGARAPLAAADNAPGDHAPDDHASDGDDLRGVEVELRNVSVRAGGHVILRDVDLRLEPGEHVAVVGPSGAGKSTLVGLLLGWHRPMAGEVRVDGAPLDAAALEALRQEAAWVDPAVQLWNRSLFHNLRYATAAGGAPGLPLDELLAESDLDAVLAKLPEGLRTPLGEGGALVSGGEGQRVRLGRALFTPGTRLAVLDEPFRGLDRDTRRTLLARTRRLWSSSTLLCVTHDVDDVDVFPRILVVEDGRVVEDGAPAELLARPDSRYGALLAAELEVRKLWGGEGWRRLRAESGDVAEAPRGAGR